MRLAILAAPLAAVLSVPAIADEAPEETNASTEETAATTEEAKKKSKKEESKRICRYIRADASSRRKTRVCMTAEAWREANQGN